MSAVQTATDLMRSGLTAAGFTLVILLVFIGLYWLIRGFPPASRLVVEYNQEIGIPTDKAHFMFFYTKWCPYSQEAMPVIKSLEETVKERTYGGKTVDVQFVNCETDKKCSEFKVDSYPTYKVKTTSKTFEYLGPPKLSVLRGFLVDALGPELAVVASPDSQ